MEYDHVRYRVLFQISATRPEVSQQLRDADALEQIAQRIASLIAAGAGDAMNEASINSRLLTLSNKELLWLEQMFRVVFSLTICWGPLSVNFYIVCSI